ncbi:helix-turn-helix domain-containing protein [Streptomyces hesseae]|uniref:Helix-turn-helix transcriptional regulator n=1 Tax=Streptomyces hesseae TaxID=3075519 RepID=A0ABU2SJ88_9ACTN|nr:helix-turn-helix transcriptional regulator [Streptomyces sp. DSM 40473]MDT0447840.1 helix-turn-helix transcriptional regulator [Streptomyces sp. DSM 40473]
MPRPWRTPNQLLRSLLREAGWSGARLAREVNALAAEQHRSLHYDRSAVSHWLSGTRPRGPTADLVAEAFTRRLGRRIDATDTGLTDRVRTAGPPTGASTATASPALRLLRLGTTAAGTGVYSPSVSLMCHWERGLPALDDVGTPPPAPGHPDLAAVRTMLGLFSRHEACFGGGSTRPALRAYLTNHVAGWLGQDLRPTVRRELLTSAGQLAYLCAFTHFDCELHAAAQDYYLAAAELARWADDRLGHATALRGLSVQALALGHTREADLLAARAARTGPARDSTPGRRAFFLGQLALTRAAVGEQRQADMYFATAAAHLHEEEGRPGPAPAPTPVGAFHLGSLALQQACAARMRGDGRREVAHLGASLRQRPRGELRGRALGLAALAEAQLGIGHLDQACATWLSFLDLCPHVESARVTDRLRTLLARLRPHTANHGAADVHERAQELRIRLLRRRDTAG